MSDGDQKRDRNPWEDRYDRDDAADQEDVDDDRDAAGDASETSESAETAEASKRAETAETSETSEPSKSAETVRDRKNVNMYLPEGLVDDLQLRYSELNVEWRRRHGEDMPKNEQFYPAAIRAALGDASIEEELGLDEE